MHTANDVIVTCPVHAETRLSHSVFAGVYLRCGCSIHWAPAVFVPSGLTSVAAAAAALAVTNIERQNAPDAVTGGTAEHHRRTAKPREYH
jgi:hypothetical protein